MEIFFVWVLVMAAMIAWFIVVILTGKYTVGKDAKFWQIMAFLILAGPLGWITLGIIFMYEVVDRVSNMHEKNQKG